MTIGIAAITDRPKSRQYPKGTGRELIIMAADRQVTYEGSGSAVKMEAEAPKMMGLLQMTRRSGRPRCGWHMLYAGDTDESFRIVEGFRASTKGWERRTPKTSEIGRALSAAILAARSAAYAEVLARWQLTHRLVFGRSTRLAPLPEKISDDVIDATREFERDWGCDLLACGYDEYDRPTILRANPRGGVYSEVIPGFASIGAGDDLARARLLRRNTQPSDPFENVLFKVFDAKQEAELEPSVGPELDAWVLTLN